MNKDELKIILENHKIWLNDNNLGKRADLQGIDLKYANLKYTNLRDANLQGADLRYADLRGANLKGANLQRVYLQGADLQDADLQRADLRGTNLDFSVFPLWCGGKNWIVDEKLPRMLAAFICSMKCDDQEIKEMQKLLLPYAKKSHRAKDILE